MRWRRLLARLLPSSEWVRHNIKHSITLGRAILRTQPRRFERAGKTAVGSNTEPPLFYETLPVAVRYPQEAAVGDQVSCAQRQIVAAIDDVGDQRATAAIDLDVACCQRYPRTAATLTAAHQPIATSGDRLHAGLRLGATGDWRTALRQPFDIHRCRRLDSGVTPRALCTRDGQRYSSAGREHGSSISLHRLVVTG